MNIDANTHIYYVYGHSFNIVVEIKGGAQVTKKNSDEREKNASKSKAAVEPKVKHVSLALV